MGGVSVIARRLNNNNVQYGWSGNGGHFSFLGARLIEWYDTPDLIDYLFDLGEFRMLGKPGSENGGTEWYLRHCITGVPHSFGNTERKIFSKILFIDYGYMYDLDNKWYYIIPDAFRIKIPLRLIDNYLSLNNLEYEFDYCRSIKKGLMEYIFTQYILEDNEFYDYVKNKGFDVETVRTEIFAAQNPLQYFFDYYQVLYDYFDDWAVVSTNDDTEIIGYKVRKKEQVHLETIYW